MVEVCLVCVAHDPSGRWVDDVRRTSGLLESIYSSRYVAVSDQSSQALIEALTDVGFKVRIVPKAGAANARRDALRFVSETSFQYFHYCDMDRVLTWAANHPAELQQVKNDIIRHDYVIFGRTQQAFLTHPESWVKTEEITNRIVSLELGCEVDITAGSCGLSRETLQLILQHSVQQMTDAEWAMIVKRIGRGTIGYRAVDGLEYVVEINGPETAQLDSSGWLARLKLSYIISQSAVMTGRQADTFSQRRDS